MSNSQILNGRRAVVFGAGGSVGVSFAKDLAAEGAEVFFAAGPRQASTRWREQTAAAGGKALHALDDALGDRHALRCVVAILAMVGRAGGTREPPAAAGSTSASPAPSAPTRSTVAGVLWGNHMKLIARVSDRPRIQAFYRDILGCEVGPFSHVGGPQDTDRIRFTNDFFLGVHYDDSALSEADQKKAIWLELQTENPDDLKRKVQAFGIQGFDYFDKDHFYFQAPGGQVFRIANK